MIYQIWSLFAIRIIWISRLFPNFYYLLGHHKKQDWSKIKLIIWKIFQFFLLILMIISIPFIYLIVLIMLPYFIYFRTFESRRGASRKKKNFIKVILLIILGIILFPISLFVSILGAMINLCITVHQKCKKKKSIPNRVPITIQER